MEENMNDMHGEEAPRTDLTLFSEKIQELKSQIASVIGGAGTYCRPGVDGYSC